MLFIQTSSVTKSRNFSSNIKSYFDADNKKFKIVVHDKKLFVKNNGDHDES